MACSFIEIFHYSTNILSCILCGSVALGYKDFSVLQWASSLSSYWHYSGNKFYIMLSSSCAVDWCHLVEFIKERREVLEVGGYLKITVVGEFPIIEFWLKIKLHRLVHWKMALIITIIFWLHVFQCTVILFRIYNDYLLLVDYASITFW